MSKWSRERAEKELAKTKPARGAKTLAAEVLKTLPPKKNGYPPTPIDVEQVRKLASIQCTYEEIAAVMNLGKDQFIQRINGDPELRQAIEQGWANGRASFRRLQVKLLEAGNATMGIWLGKQYLGQRDYGPADDAQDRDAVPGETLFRGTLEELLIQYRRMTVTGKD